MGGGAKEERDRGGGGGEDESSGDELGEERLWTAAKVREVYEEAREEWEAEVRLEAGGSAAAVEAVGSHNRGG